MKIYVGQTNNYGRSRVAVIVVVACVMIVAVGLGALLGKYYPGNLNFVSSVKEIVQPPFDGKRVVRILILGEDNTGGKRETGMGLSDTIMLLSVNLDTGRAAALSIPRDTRVDLQGYGGECKINAAHAIGGPTLVGTAVEQLVGIRPDYYVKTNVEGFVKLVDILGGVEIDVEKNMRYTDRWGGLYINLRKGRQMLDGQKAMQYVRFRHDVMGDITRIQRQQRFLKALAKQSLSPANLPKLPRTIPAALENVQTDMNVKDIIYLARFASKLDMNQVETETLPGTPEMIGGGSYWIADLEKTSELVQKLFFSQSVVGLPKVEVLNGSGVTGAGRRVADFLRERGYEVTSVGNADTFDYTSSEVITHHPDTTGIDEIARITNSTIVKHEQDSASRADVTIIVGRDSAFAGSGS